MKKAYSAILLLIGLFSCASFFYLKTLDCGILPLLVAKLTPCTAMCVWLISARNKNRKWTLMLSGIVCSLLCDLFMELPNQAFQLFGIVSNMIGLVFYVLYFFQGCRQRNLFDLIPISIVIMSVFSVIARNTHELFIPVALYCLFFIAFLWRSITRTRDPGITATSKRICVLGSICIVCSDSLLSFQMFSILKQSFFHMVLIMMLWWTGLLSLTVMAGIEERTA